MDDAQERGMGTLAHILGLITGFLGPLIIYLVKPEEGFARDQAREALNFQITVMIAVLAAGLLSLVLIGLLLLPLIFIADLILCIMAAVAANRGERYRYPFALRLIPSPEQQQAS